MYIALVMMRQLKNEFEQLRFYLLLESFLYHDIITGVATPEELELATKTKQNLVQFYDIDSYDSESEDSVSERMTKMILGDLKQASIIMAKYKQPSFFDKKVFDNPDEVYKELKILFRIYIK
jgi:hypothetical protein